MHQALLFDMDGVIVDTEASVRAFWQQLAREHGYSLSAHDLEEHVYGYHADHTLRTLFPYISSARRGKVYERLRQDQENTTYTPIRGVLTLLEQLRMADVRLALVTGAQDWKVTEVLGQLNLEGAFDVQVCADDVTEGKPHPACYLLAAQRLCAEITRCLVFEDAISGVTSAVTAGAACAAIVPPHRARQALTAGAFATARDFSEMTFRRHAHTLRIGAGTEYPLQPQKRQEHGR